MKIRGSFVMREIAGEHLAIPVNETALHFGGMIILNPVSQVIWECLQTETDLEDIVDAITRRFDVCAKIAREDAIAFIDQMRSENLLDE